ncbi:MAG: sugar phosphate nucleotidyltransferase [Euryarchaeota archaeon]|nr:sugar phosphate nucleotidyltransferase [Euryarchaeota archaeon]
MKTVIMAGGYATRLLPLTERRAKPLLPVAGKPIIDYILERIPSDDIVISTNKRFRENFAEWRSKKEKNIDILIEETRKEEEKLGTIGAIAYLIKKRNIDEDLMIVAGDNLFSFELAPFIEAYTGIPLIGLYDMKDKKKIREKYGVALIKGNRVRGFQEKPQNPKSTLVSIGCYIYPKNILPLFSEFLRGHGRKKDAPGYFNEWLCKKREMRGHILHGDWYDIGDRASYIRANMAYAGGTYKGENVRAVNSTIANSVILENTEIKDSVLRGCIVDRDVVLEGIRLENCIVGEGTRIRDEQKK